MATQYQIKYGDTLGQLAQTHKTSISELMKVNPQITNPDKIFAGAQLNLPSQQQNFNTQIPNPAPAPVPINQPKLPEQTAPQTQNAYFESSTSNLNNARTAVEKSYSDQLQRIEQDKAQTQKEIDSLSEKEEALIETDIQPLLKPFREDLENKERERLYITENFEANQKLTRELGSLLTEGNNLIKQRQNEPILTSSVFNKKMSKTLGDISARTGVIEAVMSARSGQISEAYRMIDRSISVITADRQDSLNYFNTVLDFYRSKRDDKEKKVLNLTKDQKDFVERQIGLLENDLTQAESNAQSIRNALTDPDTALLYAQAGVTLNDTPQEINEKLAEATYARETQQLSNEMSVNGYTYIAPGQAVLPGHEAVEVTDSKGNIKQYSKPVGSRTSTVGSRTSTGGSDTDDPIEPDEYSLAEDYVNYSENVDKSDAELKSDLLRDSDLQVSEINAIIAARQKPVKPALTPDIIEKQAIKILESTKDTLTRDEAYTSLESKLKTALKLKNTDTLPITYKNAVDAALTEVYGKTWWERFKTENWSPVKRGNL